MKIVQLIEGARLKARSERVGQSGSFRVEHLVSRISGVNKQETQAVEVLEL